MFKIHCVNVRESPREEPTSWERKAKGLTKMREKQKDQRKGAELSEAELHCTGAVAAGGKQPGPVPKLDQTDEPCKGLRIPVFAKICMTFSIEIHF